MIKQFHAQPSTKPNQDGPYWTTLNALAMRRSGVRLSKAALSPRIDLVPGSYGGLGTCFASFRHLLADSCGNGLTLSSMLMELTVVEQRYRAVPAVIGEGLSVTAVASGFGLSRHPVHSWLNRKQARKTGPNGPVAHA
jgi:hypothetical protein